MGVDVHAVGLSSLVFDIADLLRSVHHRIGVGHAGHRSNAAVSGGGSTGKNVFFVGEAGVTQMYVHVHQTGAHHKTVRIDYLVSLLTNILFQLDHFSVFDIQVLDGYGAAYRVHDSSVFDQKFHNKESSKG